MSLKYSDRVRVWGFCFLGGGGFCLFVILFPFFHGVGFC